MKIDLYISELLYEHDCVIIPGFGGVVTNYRPSFLNPAHHTFTPPSKKLAFNASLRSNDGLLANHLSNRLTINYNDACNVISEFVNDCIQSIQSGNKLTIEKVGVVYLDGEKNLQFVPDTNINYLKSSFGLSVLQSPAIKRDTVHKETIAVTKKQKQLKIAAWRILEVIPAAAVLALLIVNPNTIVDINKQLAAINPFAERELVDMSIVKPPVKEKTITVAPQEFKASVEGKNETKETAFNADQKDTTIEEATPDKTIEELQPSVNIFESPKVEEKKTETTTTIAAKEVLTETKITVTKNKQYHIIGGCFGVYENAEKFCQQLIIEGFEAAIIGKNNKGLHMVSMFSAEDIQHVEKQLALIKNEREPHAWLFRK